jgi:hypothetical protein
MRKVLAEAFLGASILIDGEVPLGIYLLTVTQVLEKRFSAKLS